MQVQTVANKAVQRTKEEQVADSAARLRGGGGAGAAAAAAAKDLAAATQQLRLKCTGHRDWSLDQASEESVTCFVC